MSTTQEALNLANPNFIAAMFRKVLIGDIIAGLIPRNLVRAVASSATHIEPEAGAIFIVAIADDAALLQIEAGTAGAGEVLVVYDSEGVATLTFGDGAQTAYRVVKQVLSTGLGTTAAEDSGVPV